MKHIFKYFTATVAALTLLTACKSNSSISVPQTDSSQSSISSGFADVSSSAGGSSNVFSGSSAESTSGSYAESTSSSSTVMSVEENIASSVVSETSAYHEASSVESSSFVVSSSSMTASSSTRIEPVVPTEPADPIDAKIAQMSLRERVYQMFFVTPEQITDGGVVTSPLDLSERPVGGVLFMGANLETVSQTQTMLSQTQKSALENGVGVFLAVDEEGGRVARCAKNLGTTSFSPMAEYGAENDYNTAYNIGKTIGGDLKTLGFNVDFAPVADVDISPYNELGDRIFSDDADVVANMVSGVVKGLQNSGVSATLKHFPGLGAENGNTHTDSSIIIDRTLSQLRETEFVPFRKGIAVGADFVMIGHQQVSAFGDGLPADLSYTAVTEILRGELGFNGIAITDAQVMNTISNVYSSATAAKLSVKAGIDMILCPSDLESAVNAVISAVESGEISEQRINQSVRRILLVKQKAGLL